MKTLLLDTVRWDLVANAAGDIALASEPYALAQDAASAIRLFAGELWYDTAKGLPYFTEILGKSPPIALMKARFAEAAETVPDVASAQCFIASIRDRVVTGQVQIVGANADVIAAAAFTTPPIPPEPPSGSSLDFTDEDNSQNIPVLPGL